MVFGFYACGTQKWSNDFNPVIVMGAKHRYLDRYGDGGMIYFRLPGARTETLIYNRERVVRNSVLPVHVPNSA